MCRQLTASPAPCDLFYRFLELCWGYHAHLDVFRPLVFTDHSHILLLHCLSPHLPLAADNNYVALPPFQGKEAQCSTKSNRLMRL